MEIKQPTLQQPIDQRGYEIMKYKNAVLREEFITNNVHFKT
jgi:hypothetical protein